VIPSDLCVRRILLDVEFEFVVRSSISDIHEMKM
jgi:hypothetical protein